MEDKSAKTMELTNFNERLEKALGDPVRRARIDAARAEAVTEILEFNLNELRKALDITQAELADRLGVTQPVISEFEHTDDLRLSTLNRYIEALGGKVRIIYEFDDGESKIEIRAASK